MTTENRKNGCVLVLLYGSLFLALSFAGLVLIGSYHGSDPCKLFPLRRQAEAVICCCDVPEWMGTDSGTNLHKDLLLSLRDSTLAYLSRVESSLEKRLSGEELAFVLAHQGHQGLRQVADELNAECEGWKASTRSVASVERLKSLANNIVGIDKEYVLEQLVPAYSFRWPIGTTLLLLGLVFLGLAIRKDNQNSMEDSLAWARRPRDVSVATSDVCS